MRFVADLMVKMVGGEVSTAQAVQRVNKFADSLRGTVPDDQVSDVRAYLTDYIFAVQESMQSEGRKTANRPTSLIAK